MVDYYSEALCLEDENVYYFLFAAILAGLLDFSLFFCISILNGDFFCKKEWNLVPLLEVFINLNCDLGYHWDTNFNIFCLYIWNDLKYAMWE